MKSCLWTIQILRDVIGVLFDQWIVEADSPEADSMRAQGRAYAAAVKKEGKGHRLGPPALHFFNGLLESLIKRGPAISSTTLRFLAVVDKVFSDQGVED